MFWRRGEEALLAIARGTQPVGRVRSVDEREAEVCEKRAIKWAARRDVTTPGPFGDVKRLAEIVSWIEECGIENAVHRSHDEAAGLTGSGGLNEHSERGPYAFAGLVALWRGTWSKELWPAELVERLPAAPSAALMATAVNAGRILADQVIVRDAELRLMWEGAADQGAAFREWVAALQKVLA